MRQTSGTARTAASTFTGKNPSPRKIRKVWPAPIANALSRARARAASSLPDQSTEYRGGDPGKRVDTNNASIDDHAKHRRHAIFHDAKAALDAAQASLHRAEPAFQGGKVTFHRGEAVLQVADFNGQRQNAGAEQLEIYFFLTHATFRVRNL